MSAIIIIIITIIINNGGFFISPLIQKPHFWKSTLKK